jgi:hypothetical protein
LPLVSLLPVLSQVLVSKWPASMLLVLLLLVQLLPGLLLGQLLVRLSGLLLALPLLGPSLPQSLVLRPVSLLAASSVRSGSTMKEMDRKGTNV